MNWNDDNAACCAIYALFTGKLQQIDQSIIFPNAGGIKMSELVFFNNTASPDVIKQAATALATTLDSNFTEGYLATYKSGGTQQQATTALAGQLTNAQNTVGQLAVTVNNLYQFMAL